MARRPIRGAITLLVGLVAAGLIVAPSDASYTGTANPTATIASATAYDYSDAVAASSPWAYWRFGETSGTSVADASGNARPLDLTTVGVTRGVDGALLGDTSRAMSFDGRTGCAITTTAHTIAMPVTFEAWVRTTSRDGGLIVGFADTTPQATGQYGYDRQLYFTAAGKIGFSTFFGSSRTIMSTGSYNDGRWHLVQGVISAGANMIYVDGTLVATGAGNGSSGNNYLHVGCGTVHWQHTDAPTSGYLAADIDEVAIYASALSASDITARWVAAGNRAPAERAVTDSLPWAYWKLGQGSGGAMPDSGTRSNAGTSSGTGLTGSVKGVAPGSLATTFDGSSGCTVSQTSQVNPQTFSIESWFKTSSSAGGPIVGFNDQPAATSTGTNTRDRHVYMSTTGIVSFGVLNGATRYVVDSGVDGYNDGTWHHVVATLGPGGQHLYLDGALVDSDANAAAQVFTGYWHVGCTYMTPAWANYSAATYWTGTIDDTAIYDYSLDAAAVEAHYRAGAAALSYTEAVAASSPAVWWRMSDTPDRGVVDSSGNNARGWTSDSGIDFGIAGVVAGDGAADFDGTSGCIASAISVSGPTPVSLETWFRTTSTAGGWLVGFSGISTPTTDGSSTHDRNLYLRTDGTLTYGTWTGSAQTVTSPASYNDGRWHHVVATTGPAGSKLYVDGSMIAANATTGAQSVSGTWHAGCGYIGATWPGGELHAYLDGDLDEVAVYHSQLSDVQVDAHWRAANTSRAATTARFQSSPWAMWHLDEQTGTTLADATGNNRGATTSATGVTYGAAGVTGDDTALTFDGASGCAVGNSVTSDMNPFSVEAWFTSSSTTGGAIVSYNTASTPTVPGAGYDRQIYLQNDGRLRFGVVSGGLQTIVTDGPYNDGAWHHVVGTLGPAGLSFYVDGALVATNSGVTTAGNYTAYWHVGCGNFNTWPSAPSSNFLAGSIDEVTVFSNQLDAATIAYRYELVAGRPPTSSTAALAKTPTLYWKLDNTSGTASDSSGNGVTGSVPASGLTRGVSGAVPGGKAWALSGTTTPCITSSTTFVNPTTFTIEQWFRTTSTTGAGLMAFTDTTNPATATKWDRLLYLRDTGVVTFGIFDGGAGTTISSAASYNDGRWHHVAATVGAAGMALYVDGVPVATNAATGVQTYTGYWMAGCGKYVNWSGDPTNDYLNGALDEVIVTPMALTASAVRSHFDAGWKHRRADLSASSLASSIAGTGTASSTGDGGSMTYATFNEPRDVAIDASGNIYVAERAGCRLRRIASNGIITTIAGTGTCSTSGDGGLATAATVDQLEGVAVAPDGSVHLAEAAGNRIRRIAPDGIISTVVGTGSAGSTGDGGAASAATINSPRGITFDADGNLYITEFDGHRIRKVDTSGVISTVLGTGTGTFSGDGGAGTSAAIDGPRAVTVGPDGSVYVADFWNCRVRKLSTSGTVTTYAGNGTCGTSGDGAAATAAAINSPAGLAIDATGTLYISTRNGDRVRRVDPAGIITTIFGNGTSSSSGDGGAAGSATVNKPMGLSLDARGRLLVADSVGHRVRRLG